MTQKIHSTTMKVTSSYLATAFLNFKRTDRDKKITGHSNGVM